MSDNGFSLLKMGDMWVLREMRPKKIGFKVFALENSKAFEKRVPSVIAKFATYEEAEQAGRELSQHTPRQSTKTNAPIGAMKRTRKGNQ